MFQTRATVRLQHTDAAGVMFFARIYELAHVAYEELLAAIGQPIPQDMVGAPYIIPIVRSEAAYRRSLRVGDEVVIEIRLAALRGRSFSTHYTFRSADEGSEVATVTLVHVVVDPQTGKAISLPDALRTGLSDYVEGGSDAASAP